MKCRNQDKKTGFTLIEILAVLFIIGIIFSITTPAIGPMLSTLQLNTAGENLANTLESARQHAVTNGINAYVVFPINTGTDMDYKAYKIVKEEDSDYATVGKWEFLPKTVTIDSSSSFITSPPDPSSISIDFPEDNSASQDSVTYVEFKPNGAATLNRTINLIDINDSTKFKEIVFYNQPIKVRVRDIGET